MSTDWSVHFDETLTEYVQKYIEAYGDPAARVQILKDCEEDIATSPVHEEQDIELPEHLCWAICREFLPYLDDDDSREEEAKLVLLEKGGKDLTSLTPEEREAAARPTNAGDYWKEWNDFRVAQRLFADDVAEIDSRSRDKTNKKTLGKRTTAIRQWFNELPTSKKEEAQKVAEKWNLEGAPDKDKMAIYRKKNLRPRTVEFIDSLRRTMGVHCVVLEAFDSPKGTRTMYIETNVRRKRDRLFTRSSNDCKAWATQGAELLYDFMASEDEEKSPSDEEEEEDEVPEVIVDALGNPVLPICQPNGLKSRQIVVREIFTKAYMKFTKRDKIRVPWLELARTPDKYLDVNTIPEGFKVVDPSKFTKDMIMNLWCHWSDRARAKLPILVFIGARDQDLGIRARYPPEKPPTGLKKVAYDDGSDDLASDEAEEASGSLVMQSPSKRPYLSDQPAVPDKQSPAANISNRSQFLYSLSSDSSYKALLDGVLALPVLAPQSSSLAAMSTLSLPVWSSWDWDRTYLPPSIHTRWHEFNAELELLGKYTFTNQDEGTSVVLGFGLLLRECWRAVEVEDDDEDSPEFLQQSLLNKKRAGQVIKVIKEVVGRLSLSEAVEERPKEKEKELDNSAEGQKNRAGQKKPAARKSPVRSTRSQRLRKPSRKLRDSD